MLLEKNDIDLVFSETYPQLCRFLRSIVDRAHQAEDIAQESFARLCEPRFASIPASEARFWLFRVARNLALNEVSKNARRRRVLDRVREAFRSHSTDFSDELVHAEDRKVLRELLDLLPEHQRSALLLREQDEMPYREIALILNISESKVKVDIFRARRQLSEMWRKRQADGE